MAFAAAACLLAGWALIPLASVGFFETRLLTIGAWMLVAAACLFPRDSVPVPDRGAWWGLAAALALWCTIQMIPVPMGFPSVWRGDPALFARIAEHAGGRLCIAVVPYEAFHTALWWGGLFALGCAATYRFRPDSVVRLLFGGFAALAISEGAYSLFGATGSNLRLHGSFANADAFGGFLAMTLPLTTALILDRLAPGNASRRLTAMQRIVWGLAGATAFLFQLAILFFTGSRGATVSAFLALAILLGWCWKTCPAWRKRLAGLLLLILCLFPLFFVRAQRQNVWDRTFDSNGALERGIASRSHIWEAGFALVRAFPFGTGPGGSARAMPICQTDDNGRYRLDYAHNDTLQFLGDLGWPGGILLFCGLLLLARRALRRVREVSPSGARPWLRLGAALALLAALVHSQAEFNLSARPPIQLAFVLLAGILCAAPANASHTDHGHDSRARPLWLQRLPVVLVAAVVVFFSSRAAAAYRTARAAAIAAGIETPPTDSPLLLPKARTLPVPPDDPDMLRAARLGTHSPFVQSVLASLPLANHRHAVQDIARAQAMALRATDADDADEQDPDDPDADLPSPELVSQAILALRPEEAEAVRTALPFADAALRLAPWDARAMTDRAWLFLRATALRVLPPDAAAAARSDLDLAATLYPSDAYTLSSICAALSAEEKNDENLPRILELAQRAFTLHPAIALSAMDRWWRAGIPLLPIARLDSIPFSVLKTLYRRALTSGTPGEAEAILDRLSLLVAPNAPSPAWATRQPAAYAQYRARNRQWVLRARLRRDLRAGDWSAVAASGPERAVARIQRIRASLDALDASPILRRLRLREWNSRNLLPRYGRVEWALAECAAGKLPEVFRPVWEEALRHLPLPPEQASRLPPAVAAAWPALVASETAPDTPTPSGLDLPFLGERIYLDSVSIGLPDDANSDAPERILLSWRFETPPIPSTLCCRVRVRDANGRILLARSIDFAKAIPSFHLGNPAPGLRFTAALPLPRLLSYAETIKISLSDGKSRIPQDDLHVSPVLSFPALPRRTVAPPPAPPPSDDSDETPHHPQKESAS